MKYILIVFLFTNIVVFSQNTSDVAAKPIGDKGNFDLIIQSQLQYPEALLKKNINESVTVYFDVLKDGKVKNIEFKELYQPEFKKEAARLLRYIL